MTVVLENNIQPIIEKVLQETGLDFSLYKETTLMRRLSRRFHATGTQSPQQYLKTLNSKPDECSKLVDSLTIHVTDFFRDPAAWRMINDDVLTDIISRKMNTNETLRIWSAGCATGQEVYSLAILINELLVESNNELHVSICGTDMDEQSLLKARNGVYKPNEIKELQTDIVNKYFDFDGNYTIKDSIKKLVRFKKHNLISDEPLKQMDMILCRNTFIYFKRPLQEKVFTDFYNSLKTGGYLFLGKAEMPIGMVRKKLKVINRQFRIYQKNEADSNLKFESQKENKMVFI